MDPKIATDTYKSGSYAKSLFPAFAKGDLSIPEKIERGDKALYLDLVIKNSQTGQVNKKAHLMDQTTNVLSHNQSQNDNLITQISQNSEIEDRAARLNDQARPLEDSANKLNTERENVQKEVSTMIETLRSAVKKPIHETKKTLEDLSTKLQKVDNSIDKFKANADSLDEKQKNLRKNAADALAIAGIPVSEKLPKNTG